MGKLKEELINLAKNARSASRYMSVLPVEVKNKALVEMSRALIRHKNLIKKANSKDVSAAKKAGLPDALIDRLFVNDERIRSMADSYLALARLDDPAGKIISSVKRPNGLIIKKVRVPIGVIAIIYESRPNVTADCLGLVFKSGNSIILRGGSEAIKTNSIIFNILKQALSKFGIPDGAVNFITTTRREAVDILLKLNDYIDVVIPRGGESLIKKVVRSSRIPVIKHYKGICHVYVDEAADLNMAQKICFNAKVQRPGVCNAMESMLVNNFVAARFLPGMIKKLTDAGVEIRGCPLTRRIVKGVKKATEKDFRTEYLGLVLSVKVVQGLDEAIDHINEYGSHHSDSIVTDDRRTGEEFLKRVDSACVYVNASTRFTDGYQFGLGAEIGISTDKLHARGPMALEELTTYKYQVYGKGQIRV